MTAVMDVREQNNRRFMGIAATLGVVGVATNLNGDSTLAKVLAVAGLVAMIWSIHRFGRLGPDAPLRFETAEPEAPRKKKKKKKRPETETETEAAPPADDAPAAED